MVKMKTHKGLAKRVKITGSGKVKRRRCNGGHLLSGKTSKRRRTIGSTSLIEGPKAKVAKILLGA